MSDDFELKPYADQDPLLCQFEMALERTYYPFGFPVHVATNSEDVLRAADRNWGAFQRMFSTRPVELRIGVLEGDDEFQLVEPVLRCQRHLVMKVGTMRDFAVCDLRRGFAFCWVSAATARNHAYLHTHYIEGTAFWPLHSTHLTPIHAACVSLNGKGVLFCGESEAGKSSLAYACARNGWTFITDDLSELVRSWETLTVLGNPHRFRLRESATSLFSELHRVPVTVRANGERAVELYTAEWPNLVTATQSRIDYILFLHRIPSAKTSLVPFSREKALRWFEQVLVMGDDDFKTEQAKSLRRLLSAPILEFRYSDMESAVSELTRLVSTPPRTVRAAALSLEYENG